MLGLFYLNLLTCLISFPSGNAAASLSGPNQMALTQPSHSRKIFGNWKTAGQINER